MSAATAVTAAAAPSPGARRLPRPICSLAALLASALLAGCGSVGPQTLRVGPGQTEAEMLAAMGTPTGRYPLPNGAQRVEYAKGPMGKVTFMFEVDSSGRIKSAENVLTRQHFGKVQPNMSKDEVRRILGRPGEVQREYLNKETWSWRYETYECLWAQVTFNAKGYTMNGVSYQEDPRCDISF